jgi:hypothetical protein
LFISAAEYGQRGACLWREGDQRDCNEEWESMVPHPSFERFMKLYHFKEFRHFYLLFMLQKHYKEKMTLGGSLERLWKNLTRIEQKSFAFLNGLPLMNPCLEASDIKKWKSTEYIFYCQETGAIR